MRVLAVVLAVVGASCLAPGTEPPAPELAAIAPPFFGAAFHNVTDVPALRDAILAQAPSLATPFVLGKSVRGEPILGVRLTAPGDPSGRVRVLVDGGIHGNEVYGAESAMYLASWLATNGERNATARKILETTDLRIVLLLNPDGRAAMTRENANSVDLNRNFDVDFGNPSPLCRSQTISPLVPYYYAGPSPLSEPETSALAAYMEEFEPQIYLSHHTGRFAVIRPWSACTPPHPMPASDDALFEAIERWVRNHTTIQNTGNAEETAQRLFPPGAASGSSSDWCYLAHHCVALTLEVSMEYGEQSATPAEVANVGSMPVALHMLEHAREYAAWRAPDDGE